MKTNPYLKDPDKRTAALARNIETSSAVEGISIQRDPATGKFTAVKKPESPTSPPETEKPSR